MISTRSLRLSLALALLWVTTQSFLAWHAPSHIASTHQSGVVFASDGHCAFGVNGHGIATLASIELASVPTAQVPGDSIYSSTHVFTPDLSASARGPPVQS